MGQVWLFYQFFFCIFFNIKNMSYVKVYIFNIKNEQFFFVFKI